MKINIQKEKEVSDTVKFVEQTREIQNPQVQHLQETNMIKDVMTNLDNDTVEPKTNLTTIDFNTRLNTSEIGSLVALQMLHTLNVGGSSCSLIARSIKRHKVSLNGLGRKEKVEMVQGEREHEKDNSGNSLFGKLKGFMGGSKDEK